MLCVWLGVDILNHILQALLRTHIPFKRFIHFWMMPSINCKWAEVEVKRNIITIQLFISRKQENKSAFIKTEISEDRDERKADDRNSAWDPQGENAAQFQGRLWALGVEGACPVSASGRIFCDGIHVVGGCQCEKQKGRERKASCKMLKFGW